MNVLSAQSGRLKMLPDPEEKNMENSNHQGARSDQTSPQCYGTYTIPVSEVGVATPPVHHQYCHVIG